MSITEGTIYKNGKYYHWKYRADGKTCYKSLRTTSLPIAKQRRQAYIAQYSDDPMTFFGKKINPSMADFWKDYAKWSQDNKSRNTFEAEERAWRKLSDYMGGCKIGEIRRENIERFKSHLLRDGGNGRPLGEVSINHALRHLKAIFNQGKKLALTSYENPVTGVRFFTIQKSRPDFLQEKEINALIEASSKHSQAMYWLFLISIYAGLRKNEVVNARWEWFDFDRKLIKVKPHQGFNIKDHDERIIPMSQKIHDALYPGAQDTGFLFVSNKPSQGKHRYRYDPKRSFQAVVEASGVEKATYLLMRHTFGSQHAIAGTSIYKISKWMGHSSVDVTAKHYAGLQSYDEDIDRF